ncbi:LOB domain-containing protein 27-like [Rosa sericea]
MIIKTVDECSYFPTMTIKGGTSQACAACKYQRRRCTKDCDLAPHFPADQPKMFQNAHRLYGVSNIMKILKQTHPEQKEEAMRSIIYESNMRAKFPVTGCMGIINQLTFQLQQAFDELRYVRSHLAICRDQCQYQYNSPSCPSSQLQLGIQTNDHEALQLYQQQYQYHQYNSAAGSSAGGGGIALMANEYLANGINGVYIDDNDSVVKPLRVQQFYYGNNNVDAVAVQHNLMTSQGFPIQQEMDVPHDYDDIPFDTIADDRQSYIDSKEACESSAESAFKGTTTQSLEHVSQNDLKSAAACFSLTS